VVFELLFFVAACFAFSTVGMQRSDTKKKAFANAKEWSMRFPKGHFFVVTNAIPNELRSYRNDIVKAVYDVTKKNQLESLISDLKAIGIGS
jgi:hypothetical protein